jgi:tetratricopeptide (TPR) repeat protein
MVESSIAFADPVRSCRPAQEDAPQDVLDRAREEFLAGRLAPAAVLCRQALEQSPTHPAALRQLGLIRLVEGDPAGALRLLRPLCDTFADDPDVAIALAEAEWATNSVGAAIAHFRRALALAPDRTQARTRLGLALLTAGQPDAARQELEQVVASRPENARALTYLGMALLAVGNAARAAPLLERAMWLDPTDPGGAFQLGQALRELGRIDDALRAFREAVRRGPDQAYLRVGLGDALFATGQHETALVELRQAVALDASLVLAWAKLGDMEQLTGDPAAALGCYRRAVALDPGDPALRALLGNALFAAGEAAQGAAELGRGMAAGWARPARRTARVRVGIVAAPGYANTPTDYIIDRARHAAAPVFVLDGFDYPCERIAAAHDVLFNAVSDPDAAPEALALAARLVPAIGLPVLNPPAAMFATTRQHMAERLAGIDGLRVPLTRRHRRTELEEPTAALRDFAGPVLMRPVGSHGGHDLTVARSADEVRRAVAAIRSDEVYLTEFVDFRSPDGLYRKLRLMFVGGRLFPFHLAIGEHWLVHYFRTRMATDARLRAEEAAFLHRPEEYLGPLVCAALAAVPARVGLDFFGADAAIDRDGKLVLFECNATMLVRHADRPAMFDYKREPAARIRDAVSEMLRRAAVEKRWTRSTTSAPR